MLELSISISVARNCTGEMGRGGGGEGRLAGWVDALGEGTCLLLYQLGDMGKHCKLPQSAPEALQLYHYEVMTSFDFVTQVIIVML